MSSPSVMSQIMAFAVTALKTSPPVAGLTVNRMRKLVVGVDSLPLMSVYAVHDKQIERVGTESAPVSDRHFRFRVACYTKGDPIDEQLDPMLVWAVQALMADQSFGGLISGLQQEESGWGENYEGDELYGRVGVDFIARYPILAADPTTNGT
jgi:hypothetical protein